MAYPPPVPPATRTDATVMATNHPSDHNLISAALTEILNHVAVLETSLYPIGSIILWGNAAPPGNHLICDGQAVSRTAYPEVFAFYGVKFGVGDGSSTFNLPDMRGKYAIGYNPGGTYFTAGIGEKYGSADAAVVAHSHVATGLTVVLPNHFHRTTSDPAVNVLGAHSGGVDLKWSPTGFDPPAPEIDYYSNTGDAGGGTFSIAGSTAATGGAATNANLPPSVSFIYVMRVH